MLFLFCFAYLFLFWYKHIQLSKHHLLKDFSSSTELIVLFAKSQFSLYVCLFLDCIRFHCSVCLFLCQFYTVLITITCRSLKTRKSFHSFLISLCLLHFHMNFRLSLPISSKHSLVFHVFEICLYVCTYKHFTCIQFNLSVLLAIYLIV